MRCALAQLGGVATAIRLTFEPLMCACEDELQGSQTITTFLGSATNVPQRGDFLALSSPSPTDRRSNGTYSRRAGYARWRPFCPRVDM
jgi:hypothetical protein